MIVMFMGNRWESDTVTSAVMLMRKHEPLKPAGFEKAFPKLKLSQKTRHDDAMRFWAEETNVEWLP